MPAKKSELQYLVSTEMTALNQSDDVAIAGYGSGGETFLGCSDSDTSLVVDSASSLQKGQTIKLDQEEMTISSISTNTLTVVRGANSTAAKRHLDNTKVYSKIWTDATITGTTNSAVLQMEIKDTYLNARVMFATLYNQSTDPFNGTASNAKCQFTGVFTDYMPIRVRESETKEILFYGLVYDAQEKYDKTTGTILVLECRDALALLAGADSGGAVGYKIDASGSTGDVVVVGSSTLNTETNLYNQTVASRSGLIRSLIAQFAPKHMKSPITSNIYTTIPRSGFTLSPGFDTTGRYAHSVQNFNNDGVYRLGGSNQKSVLKHIMDLAASDPHLAAGSSNQQTYGYDFYLDPFFRDIGSTNEVPLPFLDYFKRGTRPNSAINTTPAYGLSLKLSHGNIVPTGQLHLMSDFSFEESKAHIFTKAVISYKESTTIAGGIDTNLDGITTMEMLRLESWNRPTDFICTPNETGDTAALKSHINISGGGSVGTNDANSAEWVQVKIGGTWTPIARLQWLNRTDFYPNTDTTGNGVIPDASPVYALISDVQANIDPVYFQEGQQWRQVPETKGTLAFSNYKVRSQLAESMNGIDTGSAVTLDVDDGSKFYANTVVTVDSEHLFINSISGNELTVLRDHDGSPVIGASTLASHSDNAQITNTVRLLEKDEVADVTALAADYNDSVTTIDVDDSSSLAVNQVIKIGSEHMLITANSDGTGVGGSDRLTVTRGHDGIRADGTEAAHSEDDVVHAVGIPAGGTGSSQWLISVPVNANFGINCVLKIDNEYIRVDNVSNTNNNIAVTRGFASSTAAIHYTNALVSVVIPDSHHNIFDVAGGHSISATDKIRINDEEMTVSAVSSNTITVDRGTQSWIDPRDTQLGFGPLSVGQLAEALDDSETAITLDSTSRVPATGDFFRPHIGVSNMGSVLTIGSEDIFVTANNTGTNTLTVQRGYNSTTAQAHADDSIVYAKTHPFHGNVDHGGLAPTVYSAYASFTIKERLANQLDGVDKPYKSSIVLKEPRAIREQIASMLLRNRSSIKRGSFVTTEKPAFYFDKSPDAVTSTTTNSIVHQNITFNSFDVKDYGVHAGATVVKLDSAGDLTTTYGYIFNVTLSSGDSTIQVMWNTGTISASDTVRLFVPVRAGDLVYVRNDLVNVEGKFLVTQTLYREQGGVSQTKYEVVEQTDNTTGAYAKNKMGGFAKKSDVLSKSDSAELTSFLSRANAICTIVFSLADDGTTSKADRVDWAAGALVWNGKKRSIDAGTTASTMISAAAGNTGQATDGSAANMGSGADYLVFYPGTGTALKTIRKAAYRNVEDDDNLIIATCRYQTDGANYTVLINKENGGGVGDAQFNVTSSRLSRGAEGHSHTSSIRYKDDVEPLAIDTSKIFDLVPKSFTWKDKDSPNFGPDYGLIAEEVHEIFPELVKHNIVGRRSYALPGEGTEPYGVKYEALTVMLMEEVRKLRKRLDDLES